MRKISLLFLVTLLITALAGCNFGVGSADAGNEDPYVELEQSDGVSDDNTNAPTVTATTTAGETGQYIVLQFGGYDVDEGSVGEGITVYSQAANASGNGYALYAQTALTPTSTEVVTDGPGSVVTLTYNLTNVDTSPLALFVDASELTFNGGTVQYDLDGDGVAGEAEDDNWSTITLAGATTTLTAGTDGVVQDPRASVGFEIDADVSDDDYTNNGLSTDANNPTLVTTIPSASAPMGLLTSDPQVNATLADYNGVVTPASLGNTTLQSYSDGEWSDVGLTATADSGQDSGIQLVPSSALSDGGIYRIKFDRFAGEASAWNGYVHRFGITDEYDTNRYRYEYFRVDTGTVFEAGGTVSASNPTLTDDELSGSVDISFGGSATRVSSLEASQIQAYVQESEDDFFQVSVASVIRLGPTSFRVVIDPVTRNLPDDEDLIDDDDDDSFNEDPDDGDPDTNLDRDNDGSFEEDGLETSDTLNDRQIFVAIPRYDLVDDQNTSDTTDDRRLIVTGDDSDGNITFVGERF